MERGIVTFFLTIVLLVTGCGPSESEIATMTAVSWTPTPPSPTQTPIPTPIPYDLTVIVMDADANPISGASITFPESGKNRPMLTDDSGTYAWSDLYKEQVTLTVSAQGYVTTEESTTIERGPNKYVITLERDPKQLLPSEACQPGQKVLYLEDFEDEEAQDWDDIAHPAWAFEKVEGYGTVLTKTPGDSTWVSSKIRNEGNNVWLLDFRSTQKLFIVYPRYAGEEVGQYLIRLANTGSVTMDKEVDGNLSTLGSGRTSRPEEDVWRRGTISYFDGNIDVWVDDQLVMSITDPEPLEQGILALEIFSSNKPISFDNMVLCSLKEPYTPPPESED